MGIELIERGKNFLLLRSADTQATYVVRLEMGKRGEELTAAPLSAFLEPARALTAGEREKAEKKTPAGRTVNVQQPSQRNQRNHPGQTRKLVEKVFEEDPDGWLLITEIAERAGTVVGGTGSALRKMLEEGLLERQAEPRPDQPGLDRHRYHVKAQANSPSGPGSDHLSSSTQGSSN